MRKIERRRRRKRERLKVGNGVEFDFCYRFFFSNFYRLNVYCDYIFIEISEKVEVFFRVDGENRVGLCGFSGIDIERI